MLGKSRANRGRSAGREAEMIAIWLSAVDHVAALTSLSEVSAPQKGDGENSHEMSGDLDTL